MLDLGEQPACDHFPSMDDPGPDPTYPLRLWMCARCALAQLAEDPTESDEPRSQEPAALVEQARDAVSRVVSTGLLPAEGTVAEYGSPHGGSWLDLLTVQGLRTVGPDESADVIVDCFGMMHDPDQAAALASRVRRLTSGGVLLVQYHSLAAIVHNRQWNSLRHAHYAYYSTPALVGMLATVGLTARTAFRFSLYGGTILLVAGRGGVPDHTVRGLITEELDAGVTSCDVVGALQHGVQDLAWRLHRWIVRQRATGIRVFGYSAASRSVALLCQAGLSRQLLPAIADSAPDKQGRRLPGSAIPVIAPADLVAARPDVVLLFVPDLLPEVRGSMPEIEKSGGRWVPVDELGE